MILHYKANTLVGAAAMLVLGASLAVAQDTTKAKAKSQRRIPISKEAPGEVSRIDTVTVYRTDTLRLTPETRYRVDTVRLTNTVMRIDTVQLPPRAINYMFPFGMYFGLGAGTSAPAGAIFTPNGVGYTGQAQLGWQGDYLGLRGDVNYAQLGQDSQFSKNGESDARLWNFSADAKLQLPFARDLFGSRHRFALYGIGGYTYSRFRDLPMRITPQPGQTDPQFVLGTPDFQHQGGWNAGGGASLMWSRTELFVESRVLAFTPTNAPMARQIPIILGLNWYGSRR